MFDGRPKKRPWWCNVISFFMAAAWGSVCSRWIFPTTSPWLLPVVVLGVIPIMGVAQWQNPIVMLLDLYRLPRDVKRYTNELEAYLRDHPPSVQDEK